MHSSNIGFWCCKSIQINVKTKILWMWIHSIPLDFMWFSYGVFVIFLWYFYGFYGFFHGLSLILWTCIGTSIETCINYTRIFFVYSKHINCCWSWPLLATLYFKTLMCTFRKHHVRIFDVSFHGEIIDSTPC
jgi:hypothetical protein